MAGSELESGCWAGHEEALAVFAIGFVFVIAAECAMSLVLVRQGHQTREGAVRTCQHATKH